MFIIALLAALWHLGWVVALWNASAPLMATPVAPYYEFVNSSRGVAAALFVVSALALAGKWRWPAGGKWLAACLLPQQATIMLSAIAAISAVVFSHYSDGVIRPRAFIFVDQWGNIIPAILHSWYVVSVFARSFDSVGSQKNTAGE